MACEILAAFLSSRLDMFGPSSIHSPFSGSLFVSMVGGRPFQRFSQAMVQCVRQWKEGVGVFAQFRVMSFVSSISIEVERVFETRV